MKKKIRIKKRTTVEEQARDVEDAVQDDSSPEKREEEEKPAVPSLPASQAGKLEVVAGFGITGLAVGFLAGYGNMEVMPGIVNGLAGLVIGVGLGFLPYLSFKK